MCATGFRSANNVTQFCPNKTRCVDVNKCNMLRCGPASICNNTRGSFSCACQEGYKDISPIGNEYTQCLDIDECSHTPSPCDHKAICTNTPGTFSCNCPLGYIPSYSIKQGNNVTSCTVKCEERNISAPTCEPALSLQCRLQTLIHSVTPSCDMNTSFSLDKTMLQLLDGVESLINDKSWERETNSNRLKLAGETLTSVESAARNLALLHQGNVTLGRNITLHVLSSTVRSERISLQSSQSYMELDWNSVAQDNTPGLNLIGFLEYPNLSPLLCNATVRDTGSAARTPRHHVVSSVLSAFQSRGDTRNLSQPIILRLRHNRQVNTNKTRCVFWSHAESAWSTAGCEKLESTADETLCSCRHMTSFAVLMALHNIESWVLSLITQIGLSVSITCLALSIVTFVCCRSLRGTRNTIHTHLCVSLLLAHIIFLFGIRATHSRVVCGVVAGSLHAFYLASFCWMSLEGLELYLMLVTVFDSHYLKKRHLLALGYGVPTVIVIISAAINPEGYGTETHCWLSLKKHFIWSFLGPICVIILMNCGIFVLTVWKLAVKMTSLNPDQGKYKRIRTLTVTAVAQLCILGCCWVLGFLQFGPGSLAVSYAFSILNSLQGVQIFLLHCLMHRKVRSEYSHWFCAFAHLKTPSRYSEFSSNSATATHSRAKNANKDSTL
ncbi:adhesion G protein-coupled receptor E5 isoform X3 [Ascaphus truei]|uniref:adhesion G protein-coupled receptor E5 isoform X3 n=1 Tax=Ascaphus truei TaxID=8439 RepID=UPI003F5AA732